MKTHIHDYTVAASVENYKLRKEAYGHGEKKIPFLMNLINRRGVEEQRWSRAWTGCPQGKLANDTYWTNPYARYMRKA